MFERASERARYYNFEADNFEPPHDVYARARARARLLTSPERYFHGMLTEHLLRKNTPMYKRRIKSTRMIFTGGRKRGCFSAFGKADFHINGSRMRAVSRYLYDSRR